MLKDTFPDMQFEEEGTIFIIREGGGTLTIWLL